MLNINLLYAEWLKTYKRPANLLMVGFLPLMGLFYLGSIVIKALIYGGNSLIDAQGSLPLPQTLEFALGMINGLAKLMAIAFIAVNVGSEYSQDTWKMILPRQGSRTTFIIAKLSSALAAMVIFVGATIISWLLFALVGAVLLNIDSNFQALGAVINLYSKVVALCVLDMVFYGIIALMATMASRSMVGGIVFGLIALSCLEIAAELASGNFALMLPTTHMNNIDVRWLEKTKFIKGTIARFGHDVSIKMSLLVVWSYIFAATITTCYIFRRRDMAGN
jgi:ABC-2 type transport system permease protein